MGNCLVLQENVVRVMKADGKIIQYKKSPIEVDQVLSKFSHHEVSEDEHHRLAGVVRIKLVISKQELQEMLRIGGVSVDDMISKVQKEEIIKSYDRDAVMISKGWSPVLESIPEAA
ncbi:uncharacterized protein LOC105161812 [Sesamum indicum]|uniref:Uncharacterized protein LOC105161812 n=1 Tax=Sesamum indicum TaxID=4182 RepID=A0A6I9T2S9_SESIN|nr:uncharacterized protein LOC105161812 [Sesamum indicum]